MHFFFFYTLSGYSLLSIQKNISANKIMYCLTLKASNKCHSFYLLYKSQIKILSLVVTGELLQLPEMNKGKVSPAETRQRFIQEYKRIIICKFEEQLIEQPENRPF